MSMLDEDEQQRIAEIQGRNRPRQLKHPEVGSWSDGPRASRADLEARNPFAVRVDDYLARVRAGSMPRQDVIGVDSWVYMRGSRTFGFKTAAEAMAFRHRYGIR